MKFDFDAAIFDMDGTLLDTMAYWRFTPLEYILKHGYPLRLDFVDRMYPEISSKLLEQYFQEENIEYDLKEVIGELQALMDHHYRNHVRTKPNVTALLDSLKEKGILMCVATATPAKYALNGLEHAGIEEYFEFVIDHNETEYTKHDPEFFRLLANRLGVEPERCIVFEDTLYPMKSAKAAGMRVCAIEDGAQANDREEILSTADIYVRDFGELFD